MQTVKVLTNQSTTNAAPTISDRGIPLTNQVDDDASARDEALVQVTFGGTGTVKVFGRIDADLAWTQLGSDITAAGIYPISRVPFVYAQVTAVAGGNINVSAGF